MKHLVTMYIQNKMTAKDLCIACHFAMLAGTPGAAWNELALAPGQSSDGSYQRRIDKVFPPPDDLYSVKTPFVARGSDRLVKDLPTRLLHEAIASEVRADPTILDRSAATEWPPSYNLHPAVQAAKASGDQLPLPVALYLDGVRYSSAVSGRPNTVLGIWAYLLATGKRHLLINVRTQDYCRCGCRGWCSLHPLMSVLSWPIRQLCNGVRPTIRHDSRTGASDELLEGLAFKYGEDLGFKAIIVMLKGDWAEASHSLVLPSVAGQFFPCPFCSLTGDALHTRYSAMSFPEREGTYEEWCSAREIHVLVDSEDIASLARPLPPTPPWSTFR
jgi:hypothetical protein